MLADVDAGSDTPSLVGKVLKWRKDNRSQGQCFPPCLLTHYFLYLCRSQRPLGASQSIKSVPCADAPTLVKAPRTGQKELQECRQIFVISATCSGIFKPLPFFRLSFY